MKLSLAWVLAAGKERQNTSSSAFLRVHHRGGDADSPANFTQSANARSYLAPVSVQDSSHLLISDVLRQNYQLAFTKSYTQIKIKLESKHKLKQNQALTFEGCWILISWESDAESDLVPPEFGFSFFLFCFFFFFFAPKSPPGLLPEIQRMCDEKNQYHQA